MSSMKSNNVDDVEMPDKTGAVATTTAPAADVPMYKQAKVGQRCCGCCCDYRRACLVVGIIFAIYNGITLILSIIGTAIPGTINNVTDDEAQALIDDRGLYVLIISAIGLAFSILAIMGALWFNIYMLAGNILWFLASYAVSIWANEITVDEINALPNQTVVYSSAIGLYVVQAVVTALWIYPFVGLILEINKGIMSPETYPREEYSCCCTPHKY